jgi:hypothetical protein
MILDQQVMSDGTIVCNIDGETARIQDDEGDIIEIPAETLKITLSKMF